MVEPRITPEKVRELVERRAESAKLDYKLTYASGDAENRFRLAKHVMAMANTAGGYIVIGVRDDGELIGVDEEILQDIDEAKVRASVASASTVPIPLFVSSGLRYEECNLVIVTVLPVNTRLVVAVADGQYRKGSKQQLAYRKGAVLVRHGSASEPWNQDDADYLLERLTANAKHRWREEFASDFQEVARLASGRNAPEVSAKLFDKSPEEFRDLAIELLRESDE